MIEARHALKRLGLGIAITLLLTLATLATLVESQFGSRVVLSLVSKIWPVEFVAPVGDLRSGLDMERIRYEQDGLLIEIIEPHFRWRPASALLGTLHVQSLRASTVLVRVPDSGKPPRTEPFNAWPNLRLPVRVELEKMAISDLVLVLGDAEPQYWNRLSGSFSLGTFHLRYQDLQIEHPQYAVNLTGASLLEFPYTTDARVQVRVGASDLPFVPTARAVNAPVATPMVASPSSSHTSLQTSLQSSVPSGVQSSVQAGAQTGIQANVQAATPASAVPANPAAFPYMARGVIKGSLKDVALRLRTSAPLQMQLEADVKLVDDARNLQTAPAMTVLAQWQDQTLPAAWWVPGQTPPVTTGRLSVDGSWRDFSATLVGNLNLPNYPKTHIDIALDGTPDRAQIRRARLTDAQVAVPLTLWQPPTASRPQVPFGAAVNINFAGALPAAIKVTAPVVAPVAANPDAQDLTLSGQLQWRPKLQWDLAATGANLNLGTFFADFTSRLNLRLSSLGEWDYSAGRWQVALNNIDANGTLRGQTLQARGAIQGGTGNWQSSGLQLIYGANQGSVRGELSDKSHLRWNIAAPQLAQLWPSFSGSLFTRGNLQLNQAEPKLALTLTADNFKFAQYAARQLRVDLQPNTGAPLPAAPVAASAATAAPLESSAAKTQLTNPVDELRVDIAKALISDEVLRAERYQLSLEGLDLDFFGVPLQQVSITGDGGWSAQSLTGRFLGAGFGEINLATRGAIDKGLWRGDLTELELRLPSVPRWWLVAPAPLRINQRSVALDNACLTTRGQTPRQSTNTQTQVTTVSGDAHGDRISGQQRSSTNTPSDARLCSTLKLNDESGLALDLSLDKAPIRQLYAAFNPDVSLAGTLKGAGRVRSPWPITLNSLKGNLKIEADAASVNYRYLGGEVKTYQWRDTSLTAGLEQGRLTAASQINFAGFGQVNGKLSAQLAGLKIDDATLSANFTDVAPLETFFTQVNDLRGSLVGNFKMSGTLAKPQVAGEARLRDGSASLLALGITPKQMNLDLRVLNNDSVTLRADAVSNKGNLAIDASLQQLSGENWQASGSIRGADFRILNTAQLRLHVSPNLFIGANRDAITIRGDTLVPHARANIKSLPATAVKVSDDVVIINAEALDTKRVPWPVELNVRLDVGKDVKFTGFGLNSTLGGSVVLFKEKAWARPLLNGFVSVVKGTYRAYGQTLNVDVGRLIFQGSYENPGLDIRATRDIAGDESTQVGLAITGTLQRPAAKVFSNPAMSESEAMMMLLTGRPIKDASSAEATLLLGALTSLGDGGEGFTQGLAGVFQVDEFGINANNGIEQSELWVGKYLTPKLLVRYVVGIFDQLVSIGVEYQISSKLRLEAKSGDEQSVDLIYKYER